jgi:hypothetical protein
MKSLKTFAIILTVSFSFAVQAYENDRNQCATEAQAAKTACTEQDLSAGVINPADAQASLNQANTTNEQGSQIGKVAANQCQNRAANSHEMAKVSGSKAQACQNALSRCTSICGNEQKIYQKEADAGNLFGSSEGGRKSGIAQDRGQNKQTCQGYSQQVVQALLQQRAFQTNEQQNLACVAGSSGGANDQRGSAADPHALSGAGTPSDSGATVSSVPSTVSSQSRASISEDSAGGGGGHRSPASDGSAADPYAGSIETGQAEFVNENGTVEKIGTNSGFGAGSGFGGGTGSAASAAKPAGSLAGSGARLGAGHAVGESSAGFAGGGGRGTQSNAERLAELQRARQINGMTIPAKDGITGPFGPSIFEKVSQQYRLQANTLSQ